MTVTVTSSRSALGFTKVELIVVIFVIVILSSLIYVSRRPTKSVHSFVNCRNRLMQVGEAFRSYMSDHDGGTPMAITTNLGGTLEFLTIPDSAALHFQALDRYLGQTHYLVCPQDSRKPAESWHSLANTNISYFIALDREPDAPHSVLAGDRNISPRSSVIYVPTPSLPVEWVKSVGLHKSEGHLLFSDGSVGLVGSYGLSNAVVSPTTPPSRFAIP